MPESPPLATESPIHRWFGLSYARYLVLPRSVLQSMPEEWQDRLVAALADLDAAMGYHSVGDTYDVRLRDEDGKFIADPLADYQRGRRRLEPRSPEE